MKCKLCNGTGISEFFDLRELSVGEYIISEIPTKKDVCPDCVVKN